MREDYWPYVKSIIRGYPQLRGELCRLRHGAVHASVYSERVGGGRMSDPVAKSACAELSERKMRRIQAVEAAIEKTKREPLGACKLKLIELTYFDRTHTLPGAALLVPCSERTATRWNEAFIRKVAEYLRLV